MRTGVIAGVLLLSVAVAANHQQPSVDPFDGVRQLIKREMAQRQVPSVAVAVARDGRVAWEEALDSQPFHVSHNGQLRVVQLRIDESC
jgi:CubicO group peptidase (beta-lactamase class C family)